MIRVKKFNSLKILTLLIVSSLFFLHSGCSESDKKESEKEEQKNISNETILKSERAIELQFDENKNVKRSIELKICTEIQEELGKLPPIKGVELQTHKNKIVEDVAKRNYIRATQVDRIWKNFSGENIYDPSIAPKDKVETPTPKPTLETKKTCPEDMIFVGLFCIDKFEFSNLEGSLPEAGVPWFKAQAKCSEKGKRLCTEFEWLNACIGFNKLNYPYGSDYQEGKCRTGVTWEDGPAKSGSYPECVSSYGVYDMSGNLAEWTGERETLAVVRGGAWEDKDQYVRCNSFRSINPASQFKNLGFRCCTKPE